MFTSVIMNGMLRNWITRNINPIIGLIFRVIQLRSIPFRITEVEYGRKIV